MFRIFVFVLGATGLWLGLLFGPTPPTKTDEPAKLAAWSEAGVALPRPVAALYAAGNTAAGVAASGVVLEDDFAHWFATLSPGLLRDSLQPLPVETRRMIFEKLLELKVPREDYASLLATAGGHLIYACGFGHRHPPATGRGAGLEAEATVLESDGALPEAFAATVPISSPPILHSKPGASNVLYLDFNGHTITGTVWNSSFGAAVYVARPYSSDDDETTFNEWEQAAIHDIWRRVAEDYSPFDIDVTTEEPAVLTNRTGRALITKNVDANGYAMPRSEALGVAYLDVFGSGSYASRSPALIYNSSTSDSIAQTISHELGHNLGLSHDGWPGGEYHRGHGSGATAWGPIMGSPHGYTVTQWSKGEYYGATNTEDDFAIITAKAPHRADEAGSTPATAAAPALVAGALSLDAVLANGSDIDVFAVTTAAGALTFSATAFQSPSAPRGNNADIKLELLNAAGAVVASANPLDGPDATLSYSAAAGVYHVRVSPAGTGSPMSSTPTGYTAYGSAGQYRLTGAIIPAGPSIINGGPAGVGVGSLFSFKIVATNSPSSFTASGLPSGLVCDSVTGVISGRPLVTGVFPISLQVANALGTASAVLTLTVSPAPPVFLSQTTGGRLVAPGGTVLLGAGVLSPGGAVAYQWKRNGRVLVGATSPDLVIHAAGRLDAGYYQLVATNAVGASTSAAIFVLVAPGASHAVGWGDDLDGTLMPAEPGSLIALDSSGRHALGIKRDLTVVAWGADNYYQSTVPAGLSDVVAVAAAAFHSLALRADGRVSAWGSSNQTIPTAGRSGVVAIAAGDSHSLALRGDGVVVAWGENGDGQATVPGGLSGVVAIAAGPKHSLALKSDGTVAAWGNNSYGQASVPSGLAGVVAIAAGYYHSLALKSDGTVVGWGYSGYAKPPAGLSGVLAVAAGYTHSLALKADGAVIAWGADANGRGTLQVPSWIGQGVAIDAGKDRSYVLRDASGDRAPEISTQPLGQIRAESSDVTFTVAASAGTAPLAYQWRKNGEPLPGRTAPSLVLSNLTSDRGGAYDVVVGNYLGSVVSDVAELVVRSLPGVALTGPARRMLFPGQSLALSVSASGDGPFAYQWYRNGRPIPGAVSASYAVGSVTLAQAGAYWATVTNAVGARRGAICFVNVAPAASSVVGWGWNGSGVTTIPGGVANVVALSASPGGTHALALRADGTVAAWGNNSDGQASVPPDLRDVVAISAANDHSLALKADGTVAFWGDGVVGEPPAGLRDVIAITSGASHSMALKADGTVVAWGFNSVLPAGLSDVVAIADGVYHSVAIKADGSVVSWGYDSNGQATAPAVSPAAVAAAAGELHSLALRADGTVAGWGRADHATPPAGLADVMALVAGRAHSLAVRTGGDLVAWGDNAFGQSSPPAGLGRVFAVAAGNGFSLAAVVDDASFPAFQETCFDPWQLGDPGISGPTADPDDDSLPNLLEYALGLDPLANAGGAGAPVSGLNGGRLTLTYIRRTDAPDVFCIPEVSRDLADWRSGGDVIETVAVVPLDPTREQVTVRDRTALAASVRRFIRLRVDLSP